MLRAINMENKLVEWVIDNVTEWKDNRDDNYRENWKKYERLWRGVWAGEDRLRDSERSKIISPATQQAIENHTSEIEEALWGAGANLFDIDDDDMLTCKFGNWWEQNSQRGRANNSAVIVRSKVEEETFMELWKKIEASGSGEPGFFFTNDFGDILIIYFNLVFEGICWDL